VTERLRTPDPAERDEVLADPLRILSAIELPMTSADAWASAATMCAGRLLAVDGQRRTLRTCGARTSRAGRRRCAEPRGARGVHAARAPRYDSAARATQ